MGNAAYALFSILVFPGMLFLMVFGLAGQYIDRKLHARLQNRVGPPWFQPLADFIKLGSKQEILPAQASLAVFRLMPVLALAAVLAAFLYVPAWSARGMFTFQGDLIVVLYLLTVPTFAMFLAGWYSGSAYSLLGAARSLMMLFAYEVPFFLSLLAPALLANSWSVADVSLYYQAHPLQILLNVVGLAVALMALLGKLEKVPFDIPEAETEIVAGCLTEYSGRLLALFRMAIDCEMIVAATLIAAVFLPFGFGVYGPLAFALYVVKVLAVIAALTVLRTIFARLRIDQMISFCWKIVAPLAFVQVLSNLVVKEMLAK